MQKIGDTFIPGKDYENDIFVVIIGNTSSRYTNSSIFIFNPFYVLSYLGRRLLTFSKNIGGGETGRGKFKFLFLFVDPILYFYS